MLASIELNSSAYGRELILITIVLFDGTDANDQCIYVNKIALKTRSWN